MKHKRIFTLAIIALMLLSCGKKIIRTYDNNNDWDKKFYALTSDTSGYCYIGVGVNSKKNTLYATLGYYSSYQTANELIQLDYHIFVGDTKLEPTTEKFTADDSNYKLIVGTENKITLKSGEDWKNLGTQLKIDTVKNEYLFFKVTIDKKFKIKGELPKEIKLVLHTKTTLGVKDTSVVMHYEEYEDNSAPFRFH